MQENNSPYTDGVVQKLPPTEDKNTSPRHPRWTIQDTFILIQAKQAVEKRGSKGQAMGSVFGPNLFEPKWDFVSSFCREHGAKRGPVQCRKRWSNLVCEFRKVKAWESEVREEGESFWKMRNDSRREKKLPGFFDREIYDLLDGKSIASTAYPLRTVSDDSADDDDEEQCERVLENNTLILNEHGIVLESNSQMLKENGWSPGIAENENKDACAGISTSNASPTRVPVTVATKVKHPNMGYSSRPISKEERKRKQPSRNGYEDTSLKKLLTEALDKNFLMMNAQLEAQNMNSQLDTEQKKDQTGNLVDALAKIADAIGRIADKL